MEIKYRDIILRDMKESDIEDMVYYMTVETAWGDWDAPWESLDGFDTDSYRREQKEHLQKPQSGHRWSLHIDTADGHHIGKVNSYLLDEHYDWQDDIQPGQKVFHALGIGILDSRYWGKGLGTQALAAWIQYHLEEGIQDLCLQTWSGNERMVRSAQRVGFVECRRLTGIRQVRGGTYDALTFKLDLDIFHEYLISHS